MEQLAASNTEKEQQEKVLQEYQRKRKSNASTSLGMSSLDIKSMLSSPLKSVKSSIASLQRISPPPLSRELKRDSSVSDSFYIIPNHIDH